MIVYWLVIIKKSINHAFTKINKRKLHGSLNNLNF